VDRPSWWGRILCRLGLHSWTAIRGDRSWTYYQCDRCARRSATRHETGCAATPVDTAWIAGCDFLHPPPMIPPRGGSSTAPPAQPRP
jgi:hypothetical protein